MNEISLINRIDEVCEMYSNNAERIIAAAAQLGCRTDSWYVAARHIAQKIEDYNLTLNQWMEVEA